jgi:hypothetical protein
MRINKRAPGMRLMNGYGTMGSLASGGNSHQVPQDENNITQDTSQWK